MPVGWPGSSRGAGVIAVICRRRMAHPHRQRRRIWPLRRAIHRQSASWCLPCLAERPKLVEVYESRRPQGFHILSISLDEEADKWEAAIAKGQMPWRQVRDADGAIAGLYLVSSLPANFLLGPEGKILAKNVTAEQLEALLGELLN